MKKILIVWIIFLQQVAKSVFNVSNLFLLKYLPYKQTLASSGDVENLQLRFGSPLRDPFLTLLHPSLGFDPYFGNQWARSTNQPWC